MDEDGSFAWIGRDRWDPGGWGPEGLDQAAFMTAPSGTTPALAYRHNATRSLRARATISVFLTRPPAALTRSSNHRVRAERGLMQTPKPGQLDERGSQPRVAGLGRLPVRDRSIRSARAWREPGVGGDLTSVVEATEQSFQPEHGGELGADAPQLRQHRRPGRLFALGEHGVARRLDRLDLSQQQLQSIELARDLRLDVGRQRLAEAGAQLVEPGAPVAAQRLIVAHALSEQQSLDPIDVLNALVEQRLALAAEPSTVLLFDAGRPGHGADPGFAALIGHQRAKQRLAVDPVGLGAPTPARRCDRGRVDDMAFDPIGSSAR